MDNIETMKVLKNEYRLTHNDIARIIGVSLQTVNSWFLYPDSPGKRTLSDMKLDYFKIKLRNRRKPS